MSRSEYGSWQSGAGALLMEQCGISKGMRVIDFGCSIGEYSVPLSAAVGSEGAVYAVDKDKRCITILSKTCKDYKLDNIRTIRADERSLSDIEKNLDAVTYMDMYHSKGKTAEERSAANREKLLALSEHLKSGGLLLVAVYSEMKLYWDFVNGPFTKKGAVSARRFDTVEEGIRYYRMHETIHGCGFTLVNKVSGAIHFDEFWKKGEPDMSAFETNSIYVYQKD